MPGRLRTHVHVRDEKNVAHVFGPDDEVPRWAAAKITNPKAWAQQPEIVEDDDPATVPASSGAAEQTPAGGGSQDSAGGARPPKVGAGSSREVWAAYAAVRGLELPESASKADIIAAVEAAEAQ